MRFTVVRRSERDTACWLHVQTVADTGASRCSRWKEEPIMTPNSTPGGGYRVWFRPNPKKRWEKLAEGTKQECDDFMHRDKRSGDWYTGPANVDPNKPAYGR